jgi:hypothetical protein
VLQPPELDGATERFLIDAAALATQRDMALAAASAAGAVACDIAEALRDEASPGLTLQTRETIVTAVDGLRSLLALLNVSTQETPERSEIDGQLFAAVQEYLEAIDTDA